MECFSWSATPSYEAWERVIFRLVIKVERLEMCVQAQLKFYEDFSSNILSLEPTPSR